MFTGIIQAVAPIVSIDKKQNLRTYHINMPDKILLGLITGSSVANNGCCLTVTAIHDNIVSFDVIQETLDVTNLSSLKVNDLVNLERAAGLNSEIGGHIMSGHISCTAEISEIISYEHHQQIRLSLSKNALSKYILHKGYIGIDGISLTVGEVERNTFCVHCIPETMSRTTLSQKQIGDRVNIEIDPQTQAIVDTVERVLSSK